MSRRWDKEYFESTEKRTRLWIKSNMPWVDFDSLSGSMKLHMMEEFHKTMMDKIPKNLTPEEYLQGILSAPTN